MRHSQSIPTSLRACARRRRGPHTATIAALVGSHKPPLFTGHRDIIAAVLAVAGSRGPPAAAAAPPPEVAAGPLRDAAAGPDLVLPLAQGRFLALPAANDRPMPACPHQPFVK